MRTDSSRCAPSRITLDLRSRVIRLGSQLKESFLTHLSTIPFSFSIYFRWWFVQPWSCSRPHPTIDNIHNTQPGINNRLEKLNSNKASEPNTTLAIVLMKRNDVITPILQINFQKSHDTGQPLRGWKEANIAVAYKKRLWYKARNYIPVSLVTICCKVMEHVV